jgi:hypothetical protein
MFVLLVACSTLCSSHLYAKGFDHPDKRACYCADVVDKKQPPPMEIHLKWKRGVDQSIDVVTPDPPKFPRYDILNITPGLEQPRESEESDE